MLPLLFVLLTIGIGVESKTCADQVKELAATKPLLGAFKPVCRIDGNYADMQCYEGSCYCVSPETGVEIKGTRVQSKKPKCPGAVKRCIDKVKELESSPPMLGVFKPVCNEDGSYAETQCADGYCFCVFPDTGVEIKETRKRFFRPKSCKATECFIQRHQVMTKMDKGIVGAFKPQCEDDGSFKPMQCHASTGYCFCVFPGTGKRILGTEVNLGHPSTCKLTPCVLQRNNIKSKGLLGAVAPECNADGSFKSIQCKQGFCYCVFPNNGSKILGTEMGLRKRPKTCKLTRCVIARHNAKKAIQFAGGKMMYGASVPKCTKDGAFNPIQCKGSTCYCVFPTTGKKVYGTSVAIPKPIKSCSLTKCVLERHTGWVETLRGFLGYKVPRCDPYGKYDKLQCLNGMCWCTNPETGKPIGASSWTIPKC